MSPTGASRATTSFATIRQRSRRETGAGFRTRFRFMNGSGARTGGPCRRAIRGKCIRRRRGRPRKHENGHDDANGNGHDTNGAHNGNGHDDAQAFLRARLADGPADGDELAAAAIGAGFEPADLVGRWRLP